LAGSSRRHTWSCAISARSSRRRLAGKHKLRLTRALRRPSTALWADTDRKVRNQVRKAQKENLTPVTGGVELLGEFYDVFARNMRDLGTPVYPRGLFTETLRVFGSAARVHVVRGGGRAMAAAVAPHVSRHGARALGSSLREFRPLCPNMLLVLVDARTGDGERFSGVRLRPIIAERGHASVQTAVGCE
jgi:hypothetical protein